jgi:hypothetical protein
VRNRFDTPRIVYKKGGAEKRYLEGRVVVFFFQWVHLT